jgi:hypothetical protein
VLAISLAFYWQSRNGLLSALLAVMLSIAVLGPTRLYARQTNAVHGLYITPDVTSWRILLDSGWHAVSLVDIHRAPAWLTVSVRLYADSARSAANPIIKFSVWQFTLHHTCWRRLCLLGGAVQRGTPPIMFHQEAP